MKSPDIAIIGAGPAGLLLANLLARRGVTVRVLEKRRRAYGLPRAIHFDGEAMRAFQAAGLAEAVLPHTHVGVGMLFKDAKGETLIDWSRAQEIGPMGWHESYRFHQPGLETALRDGLKRFSQATLTTGSEVSSIDADTGQLTLANGEDIAAQYIIGCDGADSFARDTTGMGMEDLGFQERWVVIDAVLKRPRPDLGDYSIQHCDPEAPATYVRGTGNRRRWEMRLNPTDPDPNMDDAWRRLSKWITRDDADLERAAVYTFRSTIARTWRRGKVLIAGDAAHQMPPFMGQGMCAGVRDAANLSWKLAAVVNGADDTLLDSYESERAPHVREFIDLTMRLGRLINQTAAGEAPKGQMKSIWPGLGPGLGPRTDIAGRLAPQPVVAGVLADDAAEGGFYVIAQEQLDCGAPVYICKDWLAERDLHAALIRPDGYVMDAASNENDLEENLVRYRTLMNAVPSHMSAA